LAGIEVFLNDVPATGGNDWYYAFDLADPRDNAAVDAEPPTAPAPRKRLIDQLLAQGLVVSDEPDLRLVSNGRAIQPSRTDKELYRFELSGDVYDLHIVSRCYVPSLVNLGSADLRRLGVCLSRIVLHAGGIVREIALNDPALVDGFHPPESNGETMWRWTDGDARLPAALLNGAGDGACLELKLLWPGAYWVRPEQLPVAHQTENELLAVP
ncbi:MAG: hypothetical protein JO047_16360, partial [Alphaproteobacteria bacterium]|nr:hypothetical protein [Alphaproteobacteria bacterium]